MPIAATELEFDAGAGQSNPAWDRAADGWNQQSALIRTWLHDVTQAMLEAADITPGARVLDIAAGAGDQTLDIARCVGPNGRVLATDISARFLSLAQDKLRAAGQSQVDFRLADAQSLGLAGFHFDAAVCRLGLMFCMAPVQALVEIRKALRPGGRFCALVFSKPQTNPCLPIMMSTALKAVGAPLRPPYEPGSLLSLGKPGLLLQLLQESAFVDARVQAVSVPFHVPTARHYVDFVRSSGSPIMEILAPLPENAREAAWNSMTHQLEVYSTDTGWVGPNELLLCSGTADF